MIIKKEIILDEDDIKEAEQKYEESFSIEIYGCTKIEDVFSITLSFIRKHCNPS